VVNGDRKASLVRAKVLPDMLEGVEDLIGDGVIQEVHGVVENRRTFLLSTDR